MRASLTCRARTLGLALLAHSLLLASCTLAGSSPSSEERNMSIDVHNLPVRPGPRPATTPTNPHSQLDQNAPVELQKRVAEFMFSLDCVDETPSLVSVPGARAMSLQHSCQAGPRNAFMAGREFCHIHPAYDGSLHLNLPMDVATEAVRKGWAETHPLAARGIVPRNVVLLFGPRDEAELELVKALILASFAFAHVAEG